MKHQKLHSTHQKLTILFTGLVFCIVCILGFSTLWAKYVNELRIQRREFIKISDDIEKLFDSNNTVLQNIFLNQLGRGEKIGERWRGDMNEVPRPFLNFFILDSENNIVYENALEEVDFTDFEIPDDELLHRWFGYIYRVVAIDSSYGEKILFYDDLKYDFDDLMRDILILLCMIGLFSVLFYFLGSRFVERALRPVKENLEDMQDFIHNAGHELKTPLAVMRGNMQLMKAEWKLDEKLMKQSIREIDHMSKLIESLRELSEIGKFSEKESLALSVEVRKIVEELHSLAQEKEVHIENSLSGPYTVFANRQELHMLLWNIIKNAIKYNKKGGKIYISLTKNILSIEDTGIGIAEKYREKIFERFFQVTQVRSEEWFWIGLSLVKKIADANTWKIEVESTQGEGTLFKIFF